MFDNKLKKWKKYPYTNSVDYEASKTLSKKIDVNPLDIIVWKYYPKKDEYYYQYHGKYYHYKNNSVKEIDFIEIFN